MPTPNALAHPRIKVCGLTTENDVRGIAKTQIDSIGLNFVPHSPRCLTLEQGAKLVRLARDLGLKTVAVVMNHDAEALEQLCRRIDFDFIQLHGHESPELAERCLGKPIVKAISWSGRKEERDLALEWKKAAEQRTHEINLAAFLVDAYAPVEGGGTGKKARWDLLVPRPDELSGVPLILAGGIRDSNVDEAISQTRPDGVDTASGVESEPGKKDLDACRDFASNALAAWATS